MTKSMKPVRPAPKPLTKERQAQRMSIYLAQKKEQLFQGCLFALLSNPSFFPGNEKYEAVEYAEEIADLAVRKMYNLDGQEGK